MTEEERLEKENSLDLFLKSKGIEHFSARECLTLRRLGLVVEPPPESMWHNIIPALLVAEEIRMSLGHGLVIGNGYRPKDINKKAKGAKNSQHIHFRALDLDLPQGHNSRDDQEALYEVTGSLYLDIGPDVKMGFGIYRPRRGSRVHIDCGWKQRCWGGKGKVYVKELLDELR